MSRSPVLNEQMREATRQKLLETALRLFSERTIDAVNMTEIAEAAQLGTTTIYRYFDKKPDMVLEVSAWAWKQYIKTSAPAADTARRTAAENFELYLDSFIDLYRNHRDILCFNQYFNAYVKREGLPQDRLKPYADVIEALEERFHRNYLRGQQDGTLRTDIPEKEMFSASLHLMLAAVTRYAVGLMYDAGIDPERELALQKELLLQHFCMSSQQKKPERTLTSPRSHSAAGK